MLICPSVKMKQTCKKYIICLFLGMMCFGCGEGEIDPQAVELYRQGNLLYEQDRFAEAGRTYERIVQRGIQNGYVYFNLGNAYFKQQRIGQAILAYERASRLIPRDDDVKTNLSVVNLKTLDQIATETPWPGQRLLDAVTINECTVIASVLGGVTVLILLGYILMPNSRRFLMRIGIGCGVVFLLSVGLTGFKIYTMLNHQEAIILDAASIIRSSPDEAANPLFTLHEGTKVQLVEIRGAWLRIQLEDGKIGWLKQEQLEVI